MKKLLAPLCLSLLLTVNPAHAFSTNFLKDAPAAKFNNEDIDIFLNAAKSALNEANDGELREWNNPKTGSSGTIKPIETTVGENGKCRLVQFSSRYKAKKASSKYTLCQQADGDWKVRTTATKK